MMSVTVAASERWNVRHRTRNLEVEPGGVLWMLEDCKPGGVFRATSNEAYVIS